MEDENIYLAIIIGVICTFVFLIYIVIIAPFHQDIKSCNPESGILSIEDNMWRYEEIDSTHYNCCKEVAVWNQRGFWNAETKCVGGIKTKNE